MSKLKFQVKSHKLTVKKHLFAVFNKIFRPAKNYTAYGKKNQNTEFWIRCSHIIYSAFQPPSVGCGQEKDTEICQSPTPASSCSQVSNHDTCSHAERPCVQSTGSERSPNKTPIRQAWFYISKRPHNLRDGISLHTEKFSNSQNDLFCSLKDLLA